MRSCKLFSEGQQKFYFSMMELHGNVLPNYPFFNEHHISMPDKKIVMIHPLEKPVIFHE